MSITYRGLRASYEEKRRQAAEARTLMLDAAARWLVANPLDVEAQLRVEHLAFDNRHLCCEQGCETLKAFLPELWAEVVSAWAKEALGHEPPYPSLMAKSNELKALWRACASFSTARALLGEYL